VSRFQQIQRHGPTHDAYADKSYLHSALS